MGANRLMGVLLVGVLVVASCADSSRVESATVDFPEPTRQVSIPASLRFRQSVSVESEGVSWVLNSDQSSVSVVDADSSTYGVEHPDSSIDAVTRQVVDTVEVGLGPWLILEVGDDVWIGHMGVNGDDRVSVIDRETHEIVGTVAAGLVVTGLIEVDGSIWAFDESRNVVTVIDPDTYEVLETVTVVHET